MLRTRWLVLSMIAAVVVIGALADWDEHRRAKAGLDDLGAQQVAIAEALEVAVTAQLAALPGHDLASPAIGQTLWSLEHDGVRVLLVEPDGARARTLDGALHEVPGLARAVATGQPTLVLDRGAAAEIGLPARTAVLGLARLPDGWRIAVAATAKRELDRDRAGLGRLLLSIGLAAGLVSAFGGLALRRQKRQLELARELAVADIARTKDAELERMSRAATMAALGSGIAHELSTPLGVIVGRAEQLLGRARGDERLAKSAQAILDQAEHVDRVLRGLLGLARGAPIAMQEIDPGELVRRAAAMVEHRFARANVRLAPVVADGLPTVRCEPLLFEHALVNLLLNACDASPAAGTVHLDVHAAGDGVEFVVRDEGEGIAPADAARAIEPFFTTKPAGQGTGLGLAIAHEIVATHRGSLAIAAEEPRGTRACITIPAGA